MVRRRFGSIRVSRPAGSKRPSWTPTASDSRRRRPIAPKPMPCATSNESSATSTAVFGPETRAWAAARCGNVARHTSRRTRGSDSAGRRRAAETWGCTWSSSSTSRSVPSPRRWCARGTPRPLKARVAAPRSASRTASCARSSTSPFRTAPSSVTPARSPVRARSAAPNGQLPRQPRLPPSSRQRRRGSGLRSYSPPGAACDAERSAP